jgi:hypothetical protein
LTKMPKPFHDDNTERLVAKLRDAARQAGLRRDDPMAPLVVGLIHTIRHLGERTARSDRITTIASRRIADVIGESRRAADAEAARFRLELSRVEADTVQRIAAAIVDTANVALTRRVRTLDRNSAYLAALALFAVAAVCLAGGERWGHSRAAASVYEAETALQSALLDGPDTARLWTQLMAWNDLRGSLTACNAAPARNHVQDGRRFCDVPLWIEKRPNRQAPQP